MAERFLFDWDRFGMDEMYCFPEDALADSELNQSRHRATTFDMIRANGNIAGYNLTGMLDHALTGEGPWTFWRRWKPSAMETTAAGWSPLRWCLDLAPAVSFPGGEVELDLSLANEDMLPVGRYPASVAIVGPGGWRWQQSAEVVIDARRGPLAVPVLTERVTLGSLPGRCWAGWRHTGSTSCGGTKPPLTAPYLLSGTRASSTVKTGELWPPWSTEGLRQ